jgi:SpoVK/Ycf46/Vps4 family AAA+-type ATPase
MTSLAQVTALVDAHVNHDHARFRTVTLQIAATLGPRSEHSADQLRKLVDRHQIVTLLPSAKGLLAAPPELADLDDMVLAPSVRELLDRVLLEYAQREVLTVHSLRPARKLLFSGLPGTGKTMAASALARAVSLPMLRVELHAVIASHLGETAANLAKVFEHIREMPAVYLFDEFEALGMSRSAVSDGSSAGVEMRRSVNTLLQLIEDDRSNSLLIAATNHPQMLDPAIFRRFDEIVAFPPLTMADLTVLIERVLAGFDTGPLDYATIYAATPSLGHSDLCSVLDRVRKDHVLTGTPISTDCVVEGIHRRMCTATSGTPSCTTAPSAIPRQELLHEG